MCLPYRVNDKMKKIMCNNFADVNTYRSYEECIFENNDKNTSLQTTIFSIIIILIGLFIILILYYNISVRYLFKLILLFRLLKQVNHLFFYLNVSLNF